MMAFIPIFFFASEYAQIALHKTASQAGLFLLFFFLGFVVLAQIGGRMLDREGAKRAVVFGCAIAAVGFGLWASKATTLSFSKQQIWVIVAGAGMGMMLGPANTDAVNRAGEPLLRRGHRDHADDPELRRQPRPGRARHDPLVRLSIPPDGDACGQGVPQRRAPRPTASPSPSRGAVRSPPSRTTSRLDFAQPPRWSSTSCAGSWPSPAWWHCFGLQRGRQEVAPVDPLGGAAAVYYGTDLDVRRPAA